MECEQSNEMPPEEVRREEAGEIVQLCPRALICNGIEKDKDGNLFWYLWSCGCGANVRKMTAWNLNGIL